MKESDRIANERRNYVASCTEQAFYQDQHKVAQPYHGGVSEWRPDQTILGTQCSTVVIVV